MTDIWQRLGRMSRQPAQMFDVALGALVAGTLNTPTPFITGILVFIWITVRYKDTP